ncbi:MAG: RuBisCO large subunit C-terminal-like domain-containing protein [Rhodothermales bacterium]
MQHFEVTYEASVSPDAVEAFAEEVLIEQTFETPLEVVHRYPDVERAGKGEVARIRPVGEGLFQITLRLPDRNITDAAQLPNALFGNASIHPRIRLVDFEPSDGLLDKFRGPSIGLKGIRERLEVSERPLTATALKPVGISLADMEKMFVDFAESGIDIIKDDHYLSDQPGCRFEQRVRRFAHLAKEIGGKAGREIWYTPSISGTPEQMRKRLDLAVENGINCVMIAPMTVGLPTLLEAAETYPELTVLAHPSFALSAALDPAVLLGKLFRMLGADAVIFANAGGRFAYSVNECRLLAAIMTAPLGSCLPSLPVPAGGISVDSVQEVIRAFGNDCMLLVGGSLLRAKDRRAAARRFVASVEEHALLQS